MNDASSLTWSEAVLEHFGQGSIKVCIYLIPLLRAFIILVQTWVSTTPVGKYPLRITIFPYPYETMHYADSGEIVAETSKPTLVTLGVSISMGSESIT